MADEGGGRAAAARGRVLIVDDDALVCRAVARTLGALHDVVETTDPVAALARLTSGERFDAIVCDIMMPALTGIELHAALVAQRPEMARAMIFLTGGAYNDAAREFLESIPNPRLDKPFDGDELRAVVARTVAASR